MIQEHVDKNLKKNNLAWSQLQGDPDNADR